MSKNKKDGLYVIACGFSIITFLVYQYVMSKNVPYLTTNPINANSWNWSMLKLFTNDIVGYISSWGLYISMPMVVGGLICWIKDRRTLQVAYVVLFIVLLGLAINGGLSGYKTFPIEYAIMFVSIPLIVKVVSSKSKAKEEGLSARI
jgi:hypothetical protein